MTYIPMITGYSVSVVDTAMDEEMQRLQRLGFVELSTKRSIECNKCSQPIQLPEQVQESYIICHNCHKRVSVTKTATDRYIKSINYDNITKALEKYLSETGFAFTFDKFRTCWLVTVSDKVIPLLIVDASYSNFVLACSEGTGALFIHLDKRNISPLSNSMNGFQFVEFQAISKKPSILRQSLLSVAESFDQNYSIQLEKEFDTAIQKMSYVEFEKFCTDLLNQLKTKQKELSRFYNYLGLRKNTIVNSKIIRMGGAGNPDFIILNLLDYLESAFRPEKSGDAKRYIKSRLTIEEYSKAIMMHAKGRDTLFIVSSNDIQLEIWKHIIDSRSDGRFPYVVLDKDLILTLISALQLEENLSQSLSK